MARWTAADIADLELGDIAVVLSFPAPTPPLSINRGRTMHWAPRRDLLDPWKEAACVAWKAVAYKQRVQDCPCEVVIVLPFSTAAHRDPHNYVGTVAKAIVDGLKSDYRSPAKNWPKQLVWKGVWPDDGPEWVTVAEPICIKGGDAKVALIPMENA